MPAGTTYHARWPAAALSVDKPATFAETFRVLKPGGRLGVSDIVAEDRLSPGQRAERGSYAGCIAGALSKTEYQDGLTAAGFSEVSVTFTHPVADGLHSAIIKATKPADTTVAAPMATRHELPVVQQSDLTRPAPGQGLHSSGCRWW